MEKETIVTTISLPPDLHADIKSIAVENHRSMNMQMVHWLKFCVDRYQSRRRVGWWETAYAGASQEVVFEEEE